MGRRARCHGLLLDLDGVLRRFDPSHVSRAESAAALPPGSLSRAAFAPDLLREAVTGRISHDAWMSAVAGTLATHTDPGTARRAVADWQSDRGTVVPDVRATVRALTSAGIPVVLATNATDRLTADLTSLGLHDELTAVLNSSELGHAKPSREFFQAGCDLLNLPPAACLFVDDQDRNVRGARAAGLAALRYTGPADLAYVRGSLSAPEPA